VVSVCRFVKRGAVDKVQETVNTKRFSRRTLVLVKYY
jgi:hypothetical protein